MCSVLINYDEPRPELNVRLMGRKPTIVEGERPTWLCSLFTALPSNPKQGSLGEKAASCFAWFCSTQNFCSKANDHPKLGFTQKTGRHKVQNDVRFSKQARISSWWTICSSNIFQSSVSYGVDHQSLTRSSLIVNMSLKMIIEDDFDFFQTLSTFRRVPFWQECIFSTPTHFFKDQRTFKQGGEYKYFSITSSTSSLSAICTR